MPLRQPLPQVRPNIDLIEFEREVAKVLAGTDGESSLLKAADAIERHGCDTDVTFVHEAGGKAEVEVIAMDMAWLSPGPTGSWSEKGRQICCCLAKENGARPTDSEWYRRALDRYFKLPGARSLLSLPDIYTRPAFVQVQWLSDIAEDSWPESALGGTHAGTAESQVTRQHLSYQTWQNSFRPEPERDQSVTEWNSKFQLYKAMILEELTAELGNPYAEKAILAWVYVSPGTPKDSDFPPLWAASMFLLFRFLDKETAIEKHLDVLLSNLLNTLETAGQRALEAGRVKRSLAQVLSHEFKNLNQDVSVLAELLRTAYLGLPPSMRKDNMQPFELRLNALHLAAQATTAFSKAAYWLTTPRLVGIELRQDPGCRVFRWILYLAVHLISAARPNWVLIDIPPMAAVLIFLKAEYGRNDGRSAAGLVEDLSISIMLFFALEPVRNVRAIQPVIPTIEVRVEAGPSAVRLLQTTYESELPTASVPSIAVETLMNAIRESADSLGPFIEIESIIQAEAFPTETPDVFRVQRTTAIRVHRIPYPIASIAGTEAAS